MRLGRVAVAGESMSPTLRPGDWLLVGYGARVRPGDLVIARLPDRPLAVKRAVAADGGGWQLRGDNPAASTDSRQFGPVPAADVLARVVGCYWPPSRVRAFRNCA